MLLAIRSLSPGSIELDDRKTVQAQMAPHFEADILSNRFLQWPMVKGRRVPRNFDDLRYLELHPDVKAAGAAPRRHYLLHRAAEGRRYK